MANKPQWKKAFSDQGATMFVLGDSYVVYPPIRGKTLTRFIDKDLPKSKLNKYVVEWSNMVEWKDGEKWFDTMPKAKAYFTRKKKQFESMYRRLSR